VGVSRRVLQQRVRAGELMLNDGLVSTESLQRLYPQARFEDTGLFEHVAQLKDEAFGRRVRERLLPSQEVLAQRLFHQSQELADLRRHLQHYHALVLELRDAIRAQAQASPGDLALQRLAGQASTGLARVLATESVDMLDVMDDMLKVMCAQVTVRPSGHQFTVEGHATLLQAGLQAGLKLNYGCGNGTCGMCKVAGLHAAVRAHRGEQRADGGDAGGQRAQGHSEAADRHRGAPGARSRARHAAGASADAAQPPAALPRRPVGHVGPEQWRRRRRALHTAGGELPLRRSQSSLLRRPRCRRRVRLPRVRR
jgi:CDP-4-dehydro-6-deoxyglucose reductase